MATDFRLLGDVEHDSTGSASKSVTSGDFLAFLTEWETGGAWDAEYLLVTATKR